MDVQHIERLLYYWRHSLCGLELHERSDWRATATDMHWLFFDTTLLYTASPYTASQYILHHYLVCNYMTAKLTYLMTAYYTPNNGFTANNASFYKN